MNSVSQTPETIFGEAIEIPSREDRSLFLDRACQGNATLRRDVGRLVEDHFRAGGFLESPALAEQLTAPVKPIAERPGMVIGPYKLLQQIGEGGMGVVFMAEQTEPIQRTVALKIIKPGMDTRQVIARFEAERQAVAMMDHPNIARVIDAGTTGEPGGVSPGRPYFVMELVKGVPITRYCDEKHLPLRARLELFMQVCQAVQHAHQKGIIHRDIKPNNVLVAEYDHQTVPKVIDFGVAKATAQKLTERTMFTEFGQVLGTMEYMSPEQSKFNQLDIDTRSDIYSLGVLLYELLTGSTPFEGKRLHEAAFDEMLRIIRDEEPPKPSTRLSTTDQLPSIAANRGSEPKKLSGLVRGELDWVVMKALEKDRNRRYETASAFAADIERHLHDEAVQACPPSATYRFGKFARRNKAALLATSAIVATLLLLITGLAFSNRLIAAERNEKADALRDKQAALEQAEAQRQRAEESFRRARVAIRNILADAALGVGEWSQLPASLRKKFTKETVNFYQSLVQDESSDPSLQYETAVGYRSLSALHERLREYQDAEKFAGRSIAILNELAIKYPNVVEYRHQLAWSHFVLGQTLAHTLRLAEAEAAFQRAATVYEDLISERPDIDYLLELAKCYEALIYLQHSRGALSEVNTTQRLRDLLPNILASSNTESSFSADTVDVSLKAEWPERIAHAFNDLAWLLVTRDARWRDPSGAVQLASKAVELVPLEGNFWNTLGVAQYRAGDYKSAIEALNKAAELRAGGDAFDCFILAMAHWQLGDKNQAATWYGKAVNRIDKNQPNDEELRRLRAEASELLGVAGPTPSAGTELPKETDVTPDASD